MQGLTMQIPQFVPAPGPAPTAARLTGDREGFDAFVDAGAAMDHAPATAAFADPHGAEDMSAATPDTATPSGQNTGDTGTGPAGPAADAAGMAARDAHRPAPDRAIDTMQFTTPSQRMAGTDQATGAALSANLPGPPAPAMISAPVPGAPEGPRKIPAGGHTRPAGDAGSAVSGRGQGIVVTPTDMAKAASPDLPTPDAGLPRPGGPGRAADTTAPPDGATGPQIRTSAQPPAPAPVAHPGSGPQTPVPDPGAATALARLHGAAPQDPGARGDQPAPPDISAGAGPRAHAALPAKTATPVPQQTVGLPQGVARQMTIALHTSGPGRPVDLLLDPAELGHLRLNMTQRDGTMTLTITAERAETLDLLRRHIDLLAQDFRDIGYGDTSFAFDRGRAGAPTHRGPDAFLAPVADLALARPVGRPALVLGEHMDIRL